MCSSGLLRRSAACYPICGGRHFCSRSTRKGCHEISSAHIKGEARGGDVDMETEGRIEGLTIDVSRVWNDPKRQGQVS
jgi:hypothetical protein